jgi:hypothetical protein
MKGGCEIAYLAWRRKRGPTIQIAPGNGACDIAKLDDRSGDTAREEIGENEDAKESDQPSGE